MQGDLPTFFVVFIAGAAFVAGLCGERLREELAWQRRRWRRGEGGVPSGAASVTDPAEQLRLVMSARFEKCRILNRSEAQVLYAAERTINTVNTADLNLKWRVMAQVSLGEVLSSRDARAYSAINSKRVDLLIVSRTGDPIAAIEYQGRGHYQGTAKWRDAVKKEALRKAGVCYIEVTSESGTANMTREILRIAQAERLKSSEPVSSCVRQTT
jgi:hypothetical protein